MIQGTVTITIVSSSKFPYGTIFHTEGNLLRRPCNAVCASPNKDRCFTKRTGERQARLGRDGASRTLYIIFESLKIRICMVQNTVESTGNPQ